MRKFLFFLMLTALGSTAAASDFEYKCYSYFWAGYENEKGTMNLVVNPESATADIPEVLWDKGLGGPINPNYKSRGSIKFVKYGHNLIVEESLLSGGRTLRDGSLGGLARVEGQAEGGFYQYKFICKK